MGNATNRLSHNPEHQPDLTRGAYLLSVSVIIMRGSVAFLCLLVLVGSVVGAPARKKRDLPPIAFGAIGDAAAPSDDAGGAPDISALGIPSVPDLSSFGVHGVGVFAAPE